MHKKTWKNAKKKKNDYDMPQYAREHLVKISQNSTQNNLDFLILKKKWTQGLSNQKINQIEYPI